MPVDSGRLRIAALAIAARRHALGDGEYPSRDQLDVDSESAGDFDIVYELGADDSLRVYAPEILDWIETQPLPHRSDRDRRLYDWQLPSLPAIAGR